MHDAAPACPRLQTCMRPPRCAEFLQDRMLKSSACCGQLRRGSPHRGLGYEGARKLGCMGRAPGEGRSPWLLPSRGLAIATFISRSARHN